MCQGAYRVQIIKKLKNVKIKKDLEIGNFSVPAKLINSHVRYLYFKMFCLQSEFSLDTFLLLIRKSDAAKLKNLENFQIFSQDRKNQKFFIFHFLNKKSAIFIFFN